MLAERIRLARKMKGLSQTELGNASGVTAQSISKYEKGKNEPSLGVLLQIASALGVQIEYFFRDNQAVTIEPAFRKLKTKLGKAAEASLIARIQDWYERYSQIKNLMEPGKPGFIPPEGFPCEITSLDEIESAASKLREVWMLGDNPIHDLVAICEDHGIIVGTISGYEGFNACTFRVDSERFDTVISYSADLDGDRQRFSVAHELGHQLMHVADNLNEEQVAHRFAAALLLPEHVCRKELGEFRRNLNYAELLHYKLKYGLSMGAIVHRAFDLGIISESKYKSICISFRKQGWHKHEPGEPVKKEIPRRFDLLVLKALSEGIITRSRAAELLNEDLHAMSDRMMRRSGGMDETAA